MWLVNVHTATSRRAINHGRRRKSSSETAITPPPPPLQLRVASHIIVTLFTARRRLRIVAFYSAVPPQLPNASANLASRDAAFRGPYA